MSQQTTMAIYQGIVLECQHCFTICRSTEAAVRRNCPACGRAIANWDELHAAQQDTSTPAPEQVAAPTGQPSPPSQP